MRRATGIDFSRYARTTVHRRLLTLAAGRGTALPALCEAALDDPAVLGQVAGALSVVVTAMFRDPETFAAYRSKAVPALRDLAPLRGWHAGCATGEEVWSHAIVLEEEGLLAGARLLGTDVSHDALATARAGLLPLDRMREYTAAYQAAGGREEFSSYYAIGEEASIRPALRGGVVFGRHDLTASPPPGLFDVIFCRNVLMYFEPSLQSDVLARLATGLRAGGLLVLGRGEGLSDRVHAEFEPVDLKSNLFRRRG